MDMSVYKGREMDYDRILSELFDRLDLLPVGSDERKETLAEIERISHLASENGKIMLDNERNLLKEQELNANDVVSDEQRKLKSRELDIRERELKAQEQFKEEEAELRRKDAELQNELKSRELDIREKELASADQQAIIKAESDDKKIAVEASAVKGRFAGEVLGFGSAVVGVIGTLVGLGVAMAFERRDDGGILNGKFLSHIFRMN